MQKSSHPSTCSALSGLALLRLVVAVALVALLASLVVLLDTRAQAAEVPKASAKGRPSFVVVQTDDETLDQLYASITPAGGVPVVAMPYTLSEVAEKGITFDRYYDSYPLCTPSRVSLLTGRYSHNNGVKGNVQPNGGYSGFAMRAADTHNLATWLQGGGYRTIHVGKFLNGYGEAPYSSYREVPPGWSSWQTVINSDTDHYFYGYELSHNGVLEGPFGDSGSWETREYGERDDPGCPSAPANGKPCLYETDVFNRIACEELLGTSPEQPFFLQVDYTAPHGDFRRPAGPEPAPRDYGSFAGAPYPHSRSQGFNEGNVNDKPRFIREAPYLSPTEIHTYRVYYQKGLESLRSVDEGVHDIIETLGSMHRLRNTYIIFTSDNGFFYGEHRLTGGKFLAYEPSTHLPLLIRGPGIKPGTSTGELASVNDIAPTVLELAGVKADKSIDGRSLVPFWKDPELRTRRALLFESFVQTADVEQHGGAPEYNPATGASARAARAGGAGRAKLLRPTGGGAAAGGPSANASIVAPPKDYEGIRLGPYKYIEWPDGEKELYDINTDPYELNNIARDPNFFPIRAFLHAQLIRLETCVGRHCSEPAPPFPLTREQQQKVNKERREEERRKQKEREEKEHHKRAAKKHGH
jgi:arylsulfatase A-like enzyme